jgi:hypothetical protein
MGTRGVVEEMANTVEFLAHGYESLPFAVDLR